MGAGGRPAIRFAEELVRPSIEDLTRQNANRRRAGPPGRNRSEEEEAARLANLNKKKKGGARRVLPIDDEVDEDEDEYSDLIR